MRAPSRSRHVMLFCCASLLATLSSATPASAGGWDPPSRQQIVAIGHDAVLAPGEHATEMVAVFGSSIAQGHISDSVVAVLGDAQVTGTVDRNTVAVLGNAYVNGVVRGNVIDILGHVRLGPDAVISGRVVNVVGSLTQASRATVEGGITRILSLPLTGHSWLPQWVQRCLRFGRLLAFAPAVAWAWGLALAGLGVYLLLAALFGNAVGRCVRTLEIYPGRSIISALAAILLSPAIYLSLLISVVGIALIPVVWVSFLVTGFFGQGVALAWLGRRCLPSGRADSSTRIVRDVLVGGLIMLVLYLIPVVGLAALAVFALLGFGAVLYTLILGATTARSPAAAAAGSFGPTTSMGAANESSSSAQPESTRADTSSPAGGPSEPSPTADAGIGIDESTLPRAGFWVRIGALFIDALLVAIVLGVLVDAIRLELILLAAYGAVMWKMKGTTVGGIVCDLKVVRVDRRPIDWGTAIVRALGCFLSLAIAGLGFVWIAFDANGQAWHDKIAGTVVVRVPRGTPLV